MLDGLRLDIKDLPSTPNLYIALIGGGAALAVHPLDSTFNLHLRSHYTLVNGVFAPAKYYGDTPEQVGLTLAAYAVGRIFDKPKLSHLAMDVLRADAIAELDLEPGACTRGNGHRSYTAMGTVTHRLRIRKILGPHWKSLTWHSPPRPVRPQPMSCSHEVVPAVRENFAWLLS